MIVPIDACPVLSPTLAKTFGQLQNMARSGNLPEKVLEIEAFADSADEKIALNVAFERFPSRRRSWRLLFGKRCRRLKVSCCWIRARTGLS